MTVSVSNDCAKVTIPKSECLKVTDFFPPESNRLLPETWGSFYFTWTTGPGQQSRPCLDVVCYCGEVKRGLLRISCQYPLPSWRQHSWLPAIPSQSCLSTLPQPTTRQEETQAGSMSLPHTGSSLKWIYHIESCRYRQMQWPWWPRWLCRICTDLWLLSCGLLRKWLNTIRDSNFRTFLHGTFKSGKFSCLCNWRAAVVGRYFSDKTG